MLNLAGDFAKRGFPSDLVLASAEGALLAKVPSNVRLVDLAAGKVLRAVGPLIRYLRSERPAAMLAALNHANLVAMTARRMAGVTTRTVISLHSTVSKGLEDASDIRTRVIPRLLGRVHWFADGIVAVSEGVAEDAARTIGIPRNRINVIYNPVITPELLRSASLPPAHPWFEESTPIVLGVGRLTRPKNFPGLVDAFALLRREHDARLVILGDGPERAAIEARISTHGLESSVSLPGFVDNPFSCMARAAVFALSSDHEGLPTVLIESLAIGTPVVSTDCPSGPREILRSGLPGMLVPPGDVPGFARALAWGLASERQPVPLEALHAFTPDAAFEGYERVLTQWRD